MVLTGVEIVGIVLAIVPLCITALEHHQDEIRPFKMLFWYKIQAQNARQQFGVVHSRFHQVIELVVRDLSLEPYQLNKPLGSLHGTADPSAWQDHEVGEALIDHFGVRDYKAGFLPLVETILANIRDIAEILSLNLDRSSIDARSLWIDIDEAKSKLGIQHNQRKFSKQSLKDVEKKVASRAKLVFESGKLNPKQEELYKNIMMLSEMRRDAKDLSPVRVARPKFRWSLTEMRGYARSLYQALQAIHACTSHQSHCINLQLNCRLKQDCSPTRDDSAQEKKPAFKLMMAPTPSAQVWHALHVDMDTDTPSPWRSNQRVRFVQKPTIARRAVENGICESLKRRLDLSFIVDSKDCLHETDAVSGAPVKALPSIEWTSMQEMLKSQHSGNSSVADLDYDQIISLGLTLACSFLQLYMTEWVADVWSAADVVFMRGMSSTSYESAYLKMDLPHATPIAPLKASTVDRKLLALAIMLLELGTLTPIAECRKPTELNDLDTIRRSLSDGMLDSEPPCFREAIDHCLERYGTDVDLSMPTAETLQEIAGAVVAPFQPDLRDLRANAP